MLIDAYITPRLADVTRMVHSNLNVASGTVAAQDLLDLFRASLAELLVVFPTLQAGLASFAENDEILFDAGMAALMSAFLSPRFRSSRPDGAMTSVKLGDDAWKFANPVPTRRSREEALLDAAWGYLRQVAPIAAEWAAISEQPIFARAGARRAARVSLGISEAANPLYAIYANDLSAWQWERRSSRSGVEF